MSWVWFGLINIAFLSIYNYLTKLVPKEITTSLRMAIFYGVGAIISIIWLVYDLVVKKQAVTIPSNLQFIILMSITSMIAFTALQEMFIRGAPLSTGILIVRVGNILLTMTIGVLILKEGLSLNLLLGAMLSITGLIVLTLK